MSNLMRSLIFVIFAPIWFFACSSTQHVGLPDNANPQDEIALINSDLKLARERQYDRLSPSNFTKALDYRDRAVKKLNEGKGTAKILSDISESKKYIRQALEVGNANEASVQTVLEARHFAMEARAEKFQEKKFKAADEDFADLGQKMESRKFEVNAKVIRDLQNQYHDAELQSLKSWHLGEDRSRIESADQDGAEKRAPKTFEIAKAQLASAELAIDTSPRDPAGYSEAVEKTRQESVKLVEVLQTAKDKKVSEFVALDLWNQKEQLRISQANLNQASNEISEQEKEIKNKEQNLSDLKAENSQFASTEALKSRIEELKKEFKNNEAEIMKDGNNLVVRLKQMKFQSGRSELQPESYDTLKKVQSLISAVPIEKVIIEGHTDSTGSSQLNKGLSEKRAESVKKYLTSQGIKNNASIEAVGLGSEKPLTSNKTKEGRATNRRVDIIIETKTLL